REAGANEAAQQWFAARWHLDRLVKMHPDDAALHGRLARACLELNELDQAVAEFSKAIEQAGDDPQLWHGRGRAYGRQQHWKEALADLNRAIQLAPENGAIRLSRHWLHMKTGQGDDAAEDYAQAAELSNAVRLKRGRFFHNRKDPYPA